MQRKRTKCKKKIIERINDLSARLAFTNCSKLIEGQRQIDWQHCCIQSRLLKIHCNRCKSSASTWQKNHHPAAVAWTIGIRLNHTHFVSSIVQTEGLSHSPVIFSNRLFMVLIECVMNTQTRTLYGAVVLIIRYYSLGILFMFVFSN